MKNYLKALIALVLALACVFALASCNGGNSNTGDGGNGDGANGGTVVVPPSDGEEIDEESYRIRFVYSYTAKVVNDNGRTENKKEVVTVKSLYVGVDNNGLAAEELAEIAGLTYNGYSFASWHADWDKESQTALDAAVNFGSLGKITKDLTFYGERGNLAGPTATWRVEYIYPEGEEEETEEETTEEVTPTAAETDGEADATPDAGTEEEAPEVVEPIGAILYIEGTGRMFDFANGNEIDVKWFKDQKLIHTVKIADGITNVGSNSFKNFTKLTTIELPDSIAEIGESAFYGTAALKELTTPKNLKVIQKNAFASTALKQVILNDGIERLAEQAFYGSNKIATVVIPTSLKSIGNSAFHAGQGNTSHNLNSGRVYYKGTDENVTLMDAIDISMDNLPLAEFATTYYYKAFDSEATEPVIGNFWRYAEEETSEDKADWIHPIQYCFVLSYTNEASKIPFKYISVPAEPQFDDEGNVIVDDDGVPTLKAVITEDIYNQHKGIRYNGYTYESFTGGKTIEVGTEINADLAFTCVRGSILSEHGGIKFSYDATDKTITVYKDDTLEKEAEAVVMPIMKEEILNSLTDAEKEGLDDAAIVALVDEKFAAQEEEFNRRVKEQLVADGYGDIYKIWDFPATTDTGLLWTKKLTDLSGISALVIGEGVEKIGKLAFNGLTGITEVVIPASVKEVASDAFSGCTALVSIYYAADINENCKSLNDIGNRRANVYSYVEEATAESGKFWTKVGDSNIAWILDKESGTLTLGGDNIMVDFESPDAAPWYGAKDSITKVVVGSNIEALGKNVLNGYDKVVDISLSNSLKVIPESAFAGTAIVNDTANYDKGLLIIDDHLIKADATKRDEYFFVTPYGIYTIADGAFKDCTSIKRIALTRTITYINPEAFPDSEIEYIFTEGNEAHWEGIAKYVDFGDAKVLYKSDRRPTKKIVGDDGKEILVYSAGTHWKMIGNEYVIWGCDHDWSDWIVTRAATCDKSGTLTRFCLYDIDHTEVQTIQKVDHTFGEYVKNNNQTCVVAQTETAKCTVCSTNDVRDVLVPAVDENGDPILDENDNPTYNKVYGDHNFEGATYVDNNDRTCVTGMTESAQCLNKGCEEKDTRDDLDQPALGHVGANNVAWVEAPYVLVEGSENCAAPYGMMRKTCARTNADGTPCGHYEEKPAVAADREEGYTPVSCVFDKEIVDAKYLASAATKTEPAKYYKSCGGCGKAGSETFTSGSALSFYDFEDVADVKTICSATPDSAYLWNTKEGTSTGSYVMTSTVGESKVLEIGRNSVTSGWAKLNVKTKNASTAENAVFVLDTDIQIATLNQTGSGYVARIAMSNGTEAFFTLELYKVDDDTLGLRIMDDNQSQVIAETELTVDLAKWYTLRVEYIVGEGKADKVVVSVTDKAAGTKTSFEYNNLETAKVNANFMYTVVDLRCQNTNYVTDTAFYFDDMYFGAVSYADLYGEVAE